MTTPVSAYAEIGITSNFSFLRGGSDPRAYVHQASRLEIPAIGIADHNTLAGVVRAYQELEAEGCIETVPGKGCFVAEGRVEMLRETRLRAIENSFSRALDEARMLGLSREELHEMLDLMSEDDGR